MSKDYNLKAQELLGSDFSPNEYIEGCNRTLKYLRTRRMGGVAQYSGLSEELSIIELTNTACIADIMNGMLKGHTPEYFVYWLNREKCGVDTKFWKWLTQRSVLSPLYAFPEHFNVDNEVQSLCISADLPYNLMSLALNILRLPYENNDYTREWSKLVDLGVDEALAFCMCTDYRVNNDIVVKCSDGKNFYHSALNAVYAVGVMKMFSGAVGFNEIFDVESYKSRKMYGGIMVDVMAFGGDYDDKLAGLASKKTTVPAIKNLMGEVVTPSKEVKGATAEDLNKYWEDEYQFGVRNV